VHSNVIEKIKTLAVKMVFTKMKGWGTLACACSRFFSLLWRRERWQRRPVVVSGAKISAGPGMVHSNVIKKIKLLAAKNVI
jgi:hypothetical protein